jgi:hypothetical protein
MVYFKDCFSNVPKLTSLPYIDIYSVLALWQVFIYDGVSIIQVHLVVDLRPMRLTTGRTYDHKKNK